MRSPRASAFYGRLTDKLANLPHALMMSALESGAGAGRIPVGMLSGLKDLLAIDYWTLRLADLVRESFPACRTDHSKGAAKLQAVRSVIEGWAQNVWLTCERTNECTPRRRVRGKVKSCLVLFGFRYYSFHLFHRVDPNAGSLVPRVKKNATLLTV